MRDGPQSVRLDSQLDTVSFVLQEEPSQRDPCSVPDSSIPDTIATIFIIGRVARLNLGKFKSENSDFNVFELYPDLTSVLIRVLKRRVEETNQEETLTCEDDCCVCFESMKVGSLVNCNLCKNFIHEVCIKQWLSNTTRNNCPLCRARWPKLNQTNEDILDKFGFN